MNKDDLILISVDDHIAEPADMFDAHVPARLQAARAARDPGARRHPAVVLRRAARPEHGPERRRGQAARDVQHRRIAATTRCGRDASTSTSACAT